jgi:hypothetical protein
MGRQRDRRRCRRRSRTCRRRSDCARSDRAASTTAVVGRVGRAFVPARGEFPRFPTFIQGGERWGSGGPVVPIRPSQIGAADVVVAPTDAGAPAPNRNESAWRRVWAACVGLARLGAERSSAVFAHESPTCSVGFDAENGLASGGAPHRRDATGSSRIRGSRPRSRHGSSLPSLALFWTGFSCASISVASRAIAPMMRPPSARSIRGGQQRVETGPWQGLQNLSAADHSTDKDL